MAQLTLVSCTFCEQAGLELGSAVFPSFRSLQGIMMSTGLVATPQPPIPKNAHEKQGESISEKKLTAEVIGAVALAPDFF